MVLPTDGGGCDGDDTFLERDLPLSHSWVTTRHGVRAK